MSIPFKVKFSGRAHQYSQEEIDVVVEAMKTAEPLTQSRYMKEFEAAFEQYIGAKHCFATCNATSALELIAQLCQFKDGDEVIIPAHTFTSSAYPFIKKGANIVWADIDLKTRVVTAETLEKCITPQTKAIVVVHLYGFCAEMKSIVALAKKHNLILIEDAAQSIGTDMEGQKSGTFGDFAIFSFHSHKNITTLGEGGMLYVKDDSLAKLVPMLRHNGHCPFDYERADYWVPAMGNVDVPQLNGMPLMPNNYCLGEIECALGIQLLKRLDKINEEKRARAIKFIDALEEFPDLEFQREDSPRHNYHLLVARLSNGKRDNFIRKMAQEKDVQCVVQYYPLNRYDFYKKLGFDQAQCPQTDKFFDSMVSFPFHQWLSDQEIDYMIDAIKTVCEELR